MLDSEQLRPECYNNRTPPAAGYWAQSRSYQYEGGPYVLRSVFIPFRLRESCGQDGNHLPCHGCKHLEVV